MSQGGSSEPESRKKVEPPPKPVVAPPVMPPVTPPSLPVPSTSGDESARGLAVELVKLFITFAAAGIAFLIGAVFSGKVMLSPATIIACLLLFAASVAFGVGFFMNAVSELPGGKYRVTNPSPSRWAMLQLVFLAIGVGVLGWQAMQRARSPVAPFPTTQIDIHAIAGRWRIDSGAPFQVHKDRSSLPGAASLQLRATSDGILLHVDIDSTNVQRNTPALDSDRAKGNRPPTLRDQP